MSNQFDGIWNIEIDAPIGKQRVQLAISSTPSGLVGSATQGAETVPFLDPKIEDGVLRWSQNVTKPMKITLKFEVTSDGNRMEGKAKPGIFPKVKLSGWREK